MGSIVERALKSTVEVKLYDLDDVEEIGQHAKEMAELINHLIHEQKDLHRELHGTEQVIKGWSNQDILNWTADGNWFVVALVDGRVVGITNLRKGDGDIVLNNYYVAKPHRGQGLGKAMMARTEQLARDNSCSGITLGVYANNKDAVRLYESVGFKPVRITMRKQV